MVKEPRKHGETTNGTCGQRMKKGGNEEVKETFQKGIFFEKFFGWEKWRDKKKGSFKMSQHEISKTKPFFWRRRKHKGEFLFLKKEKVKQMRNTEFLYFKREYVKVKHFSKKKKTKKGKPNQRDSSKKTYIQYGQ